MKLKRPTEINGAELRARREALSLTQAGLADVLGLTQNSVSRFERGALKIAHPIMLALAMDHLASLAH